MPEYRIETAPHCYSAVVERGIIARTRDYVPAKGKVFVITTEDVWRHQGAALRRGLGERPHEVLYLPGGEEQKRLAPLESVAEEMVQRGGDRTSVILAF